LAETLPAWTKSDQDGTREEAFGPPELYKQETTEPQAWTVFMEKEGRFRAEPRAVKNRFWEE